MENARELEVVLEWMRLNGVRSYTRHPSGGYSVELFDDVTSPQLADFGGDVPSDPYVDPDLLPDGVFPRIKRVTK